MSLFNNGSCCGNGNTAGTTKSKCGGCVCELLNQLANARPANLCSMAEPQLLNLILKGASEPLSIRMGGQPTDFTLISFDSETCCAFFREDRVGKGQSPRVISLDCRCICGIICVNDNMGGGTPSAL